MNDALYIEQLPAILSIAGSSSVLLTIFLFKDLRALRYVELVKYVSFSDLMASISLSLGKTQTGSFSCWFQGIISNWFYLSAILWTSVIIYQVWLIVTHGKVSKSLPSSPFTHSTHTSNTYTATNFLSYTHYIQRTKPLQCIRFLEDDRHHIIYMM